MSEVDSLFQLNQVYALIGFKEKGGRRGRREGERIKKRKELQFAASGSVSVRLRIGECVSKGLCAGILLRFGSVFKAGWSVLGGLPPEAQSGSGASTTRVGFFREPPSVLVCVGVYFYFVAMIHVYVLKRGGAFNTVTQRLWSLNVLLRSLNEVCELRRNRVLFEHKHVQREQGLKKDAQ